MKASQIFHFFILALLYFVSSSCNDEDISKITAIKLTASDVQLLIDQDFVFEVKGNNSEIITEDAVIKIDGVAIQNAVFSSGDPGEFEVQAFYEAYESNLVTISTVYPSGFIKNVLVEDFTGTWCVNCPSLSWAIEVLKSQTDKAVSVGIHYFDDMEMDGVGVLIDAFNPLGEYPKGVINRVYNWEREFVDNVTDVTDLTGFGAPLGLSINSSFSGSSVNATIDVKFEETITDPLNVVVYLTENGLIYTQQNSSAFYGGPGPIVDFEHNDVLRAICTNYLGETIPTAETVSDNTYSLQLQKAIPATVQNNDELHLIAFVTNANTNEVINVREVKVGVQQELQEL